MEVSEFKTWAIVEVMGHVEYAGFVSSESIAGAAMLRVDVPEVEGRAGFTKYLATNALYGISPCSEETARARAAALRATPFSAWSVEEQIMKALRDKGMLIEHKPDPRGLDDSDDDEDDGLPF